MTSRIAKRFGAREQFEIELDNLPDNFAEVLQDFGDESGIEFRSVYDVPSIARRPRAFIIEGSRNSDVFTVIKFWPVRDPDDIGFFDHFFKNSRTADPTEVQEEGLFGIISETLEEEFGPTHFRAEVPQRIDPPQTRFKNLLIESVPFNIRWKSSENGSLGTDGSGIDILIITESKEFGLVDILRFIDSETGNIVLEAFANVIAASGSEIANANSLSELVDIISQIQERTRQFTRKVEQERAIERFRRVLEEEPITVEPEEANGASLSPSELLEAIDIQELEEETRFGVN